MDPISAAFLMFGLILLLASWIQLIIISFNDDFSWGLTSVFLPPLSYIYGLFAWDKAKSAMVMVFIGWVLILLSLAG